MKTLLLLPFILLVACGSSKGAVAVQEPIQTEQPVIQVPIEQESITCRESDDCATQCKFIFNYDAAASNVSICYATYGDVMSCRKMNIARIELKSQLEACLNQVISE